MRAGGMGALGDDYRGDGVLKDQLLLVAGFQNDGIFVEAFDATGELYTAHQVDGQERFVFPGVV